MNVEHLAARPDPVYGSMARLWSRLLDFLIIFWLFNFSGAVFPLLLQGTKPTLSEADEAILRLLLLPTLILAPLFLLLRTRQLARLLADHWLLPLTIAWIWCSLAWSIDPSLTGRRALALTANTIIACYIVVSYRPEALLKRLAWVELMLLGLSVAFAVALPHLAFMPTDGSFRGVFTHKNGMGQCLVISAIVLAVALKTGLVPRVWAITGLVLVAVLVVPTQSATALLLVLSLALLHVVLAITRLPVIAAAAALLIALAGAGLALLTGLLFIEPIMAALGRDLTLTGRTDLWEYVIDAISLRPILGYGYNVFFDVPEVIAYTKEVLKWGIPHAHNGFLEIWLGLGVVGVALAVPFLVGGLVRAVRGLADPADVASRFAFFYLVLYLGRNLTESDLLSQSNLSWPLAVFAVLVQTGRSSADDADKA